MLLYGEALLLVPTYFLYDASGFQNVDFLFASLRCQRSPVVPKLDSSPLSQRFPEVARISVACYPRFGRYGTATYTVTLPGDSVHRPAYPLSTAGLGMLCFSLQKLHSRVAFLTIPCR